MQRCCLGAIQELLNHQVQSELPLQWQQRCPDSENLTSLQELQALDLQLQDRTREEQADPFLLYLHGLVQIDR